MKTEEWLAKVAASERMRRNMTFWGMEGLGVGVAGLATAMAIAPPIPRAPHHGRARASLHRGRADDGDGDLRRLGHPDRADAEALPRGPRAQDSFRVAPTPQGATFGLSGTF